MNLPIQVTFALPSLVAKGLQDGTLERVGGVIQEVISKKIVTLLRDSFSDVLRDSFSDVNQRLDGVENQIDSLGQTLQGSQSILQVSTAASILNLGISVMGFAVISQRLNEIENEIKQAQELLNKINRKIDMSFYANFHLSL